jgi:hypothetical protein
MMRTRLVMVLFSGLTLAAFAPSPADDREAIAVRVKLGFSYLSKAQMEELWRLVDNYAAAEAFLRQCGSPSHVDRRMMLAARDCIEQGALNRVAAYFRGKVLQLMRRESFVCDSEQAKALVKDILAKIDKAVDEVRSMCRACILC